MKAPHTARLVNIALGLWLIASGFIWHHAPGQFANAWLVGTAVIFCSLIGIRIPAARYVNTLLSLWLLLSPWALSSATPRTIWNSVLVAVGVFAFSLISSPTAPPR